MIVDEHDNECRLTTPFDIDHERPVVATAFGRVKRVSQG